MPRSAPANSESMRDRSSTPAASSRAAPTAKFAQLLTSGQAPLYAFVLSLVVDPHRARDVVQDTNRVLWEKAGEFDAERPFLPWAFAIARNQVRAARTAEQRDRLTFSEDVTERLADRAALRAERMGERQVALARCLDKLPDEHRTLIDQRYSEGSSVAELGTRTGRQPNAVAAMLMRIRRALAECIESATRAHQPEGSA